MRASDEILRMNEDGQYRGKSFGRKAVRPRNDCTTSFSDDGAAESSYKGFVRCDSDLSSRFAMKINVTITRPTPVFDGVMI